MAEGGEAAAPTLMLVHVIFGGQKIPISISPDSTIKELKGHLQALTNVLPRGQKLICKGKVLTDTTTLRASPVKHGSKVMLVATQGLHQGDGPSTKDTKKNQTASHVTVYKPMTSDKDRWKITGVVALSEAGLKVVPEDVWDCGLSVRVLDLSSNFLEEVSAKICSLEHLNKLLINGNNISDEGIYWESLSSLKFLTVLSLSQNQISSVPPSIGNCSSLVEINLSYNLLVELPESLGNLRYLKVLRLSNNGLKSLPSTLFKRCTQLSTLNLHGTEITNDALRQVQGWEDFDERRRLKHQKQLDFRAGSSGIFDEGADDDNRHY